MIRLLGVLVGSALAVVALVVFVGIPEFTATSNVTEEPVITLPMRPEAVVDADRATTSLPFAPVEAVEAVEETSHERPAAAQSIELDVLVEEPAPPEPETIETMQQWYAFWSPFRSEIAAAGFVDRLQSVTGLDYRVVKVKPGVYEVAFAYNDDAEITINLSQISTATGLNLAVN